MPDPLVAFVTGGSGGLGQAIATSLSRAGLAVAVGYRSRGEEAEELAAKLRADGSAAVAVAIDVTDEPSIEAAFGAVERELGTVQVLVNNAGVSRPGLFLRYRTEALDATLDANLRGVFLCTHRAMPLMLRRRWGRVINVASGSALRGYAGMSAYAASKAGVVGLTRALAHEVGSRGVTVNAVCPGFVDTDMTAEIPEGGRAFFLDQIPLGRFARPEEVAVVVAFLAGQETSYVNGAVLAVDGGLTA